MKHISQNSILFITSVALFCLSSCSDKSSSDKDEVKISSFPQRDNTLIQEEVGNLEIGMNEGQSYELSQSKDYPYWPDYRKVPLNEIKPQTWRKQDDIITGWDWSHPPGLNPSDRSLIGLDRYIGFRKNIKSISPIFPSNPVILHWVHWKEIEPEEGEYKWELILNRLKQAERQGNQSVLRILSCSKHAKGSAPSWLEKYKVPTLPKTKGQTNYDPSHPAFHKHYLKLIASMAKTEIPSLVQAAYVGYASHSLGDEGIGPHGVNPDDVPHVIERLDAWGNAFKGMEYKVFMGGPSEYGFNKGFGVRRGFVEMYLYTLPDKNIGQSIDKNGYIVVDGNSPVLRRNPFHGEVNEEYEEAWATEARGFRFGKTTESFAYRYFCANLRLLQMRCSYVHNKDTIVPDMLPFVAQELGRTVENAPDVWCFLRESYINANYYMKKDYLNRGITKEEKRNGLAAKNWERWLYQRDSEGFETTPAVKIKQPIKMWMVQKDKVYDYIARKGKKMGFAVDDAWGGGGPQNVVVKVTYFDEGTGLLAVHCKTSSGKHQRNIQLNGSGQLRTASVFLKDVIFDGKDLDYDLTLEGEGNEIVVSFVRIIKDL
ncbi:MAG: hypothetical protein HQL32_11325 [Planctomycetes bacterium]|nr:hypothetical protein [Planctomycetota bacterium]